MEKTPIAAELTMIKTKKTTVGADMPDFISNH